MLCILLDVDLYDFFKTWPAEPAHSGEVTRKAFLGLATAATDRANTHLRRLLYPEGP